MSPPYTPLAEASALPSHEERLTRLGLAKAVSLDLEGGGSFVSAIGATRLDSAQTFSIQHRKVVASSDLKSVDAYCDGTKWIIGHNLIAHDLVVLARLDPDLALLRLKPIDTLYLSPLAFPRNPYHRLVKHYKTPGLARHQKNDPLLDASATLELLADACSAFAQADPELLSCWHWLLSRSPEHAGFDDLFSLVRRAPAPDDAKARRAILSQLSKYGCSIRGREIVDSKTNPLSLAWLLGWLPVAGGNSTIPPYVHHRAPEVHALARNLRSSWCTDSSCSWCSSAPSLEEDLSRLFGVGSFRETPSVPDRGSLQRLLVEEQLSGQSVLGIMPTGSGKSIAYQLPALLRHEQVGELTVVIMPLLSLMTDQVSGLRGKGIGCIDTINGLLSYPERTEVLKRVRLGDTGVLLIAPEQLRNRSVRHALEHRVIGAWVFDEVHCLSKWGHDFRPDYRYAARFIRQHAGRAPIPPILGLTATAKRDVIDEIRGHFKDRLGLEMAVFDAGVRRHNLDFQFLESTKATRLDLVASTIEHDLPDGAPGGALVYCVSRLDTEQLAEALRARGIPAEHYHAKVPPTKKKEVQARFVKGDLRVVVATNAFGMGIDKPDVRLVVHAGTPGSIENYLQEAGRAGRDGASARCVLLFDPEDIERQFNLTATLELAQVELQAALKILRSHGDRVRKRTDEDGMVQIYVTPGEVLLGDRDGDIQRSYDGPDTRIRAAIAILEEAGLVFREENLVSIYPSSLKVASLADANERLGDAVHTQRLRPDFQAPCLGIVNALLNADPDEGISTDFLAASCGLAPTALRDAFTTLEHLGIASNDLSITAFVHVGPPRPSRARLESMARLEKGLIDELRELDPDDEALAERPVPVRLRAISQRLRDQGLDDPIPATLRLLLRALEHDRADDENTRGSVEVWGSGLDTVHLRLLRTWSELDAVAAQRRDAAAILLQHLLDHLPQGTRGTDLLVDTTYGQLQDALRNDAVMASLLTRSADSRSVLDRALLWLHQIEAIVLHQGLTVFRQAMTIRVPKNEPRRSFTADDYRDLDQYYESKTTQIHATEQFAEIGLSDPTRARSYAEEYFALGSDEFLRRWFPGRQQEVKRRTRSENYERIVTALGSREQEAAVDSDRKRHPNLLVLAGPGSGKTRVLVHRLAWLIKVKRVAPQSIMALAYNRHAAAEVRHRLARLVGNDAGSVRVMTCHALAMRVLGLDLAGDHHVPTGSKFFEQILVRAAKLLSGDEEDGTDTSLTWDGLLSGIRWILIDEYQDIGEPEYDLISALARRTQVEEDGAKPILFAVGDDDQNIYSFKGASVRYIRQFESDYGARTHYLVENYRSTRHIVAASQALIASDTTRLKQHVTLSVDSARSADPPGGRYEDLDQVAKGRVQILSVGGTPAAQAEALLDELERLATLDPEWRWDRVAIIARAWEDLTPVRRVCLRRRLRHEHGYEQRDRASLWRLREMRDAVSGLEQAAVDGLVERGFVGSLRDSLNPEGEWTSLVRAALTEFLEEQPGAERYDFRYVREWLGEWSREARREQRWLLLTVAHLAKGLEFDHVALIDGKWSRHSSNEDGGAPRRLYYVAMTRARQTLTLVAAPAGPTDRAFLGPLGSCDGVARRELDPADGDGAHFAFGVERCTLGDVDIGWPARSPATVRSAISEARSDDPLSLVPRSTGWFLEDTRGRAIVRMKKDWQPSANEEFRSARVQGIYERRRDDSSAAGYQQPNCERWEVVLPRILWKRDVGHRDSRR